MSLFFVDPAGDKDLLEKDDDVAGIKAFDGAERPPKENNDGPCDVDMEELVDEKNFDYRGKCNFDAFHRLELCKYTVPF